MTRYLSGTSSLVYIALLAAMLIVVLLWTRVSRAVGTAVATVVAPHEQPTQLDLANAQAINRCDSYFSWSDDLCMLSIANEYSSQNWPRLDNAYLQLYGQSVLLVLQANLSRTQYNELLTKWGLR